MATKTKIAGGTVTGKMLQKKLAQAIDDLDTEQAERLLKIGAKIDRPDEDGWTLLHHLCSVSKQGGDGIYSCLTMLAGSVADSTSNQLEKIKFVVEQLEADVNAKTNDGDTPLSLAVGSDLDGEIIDLLMEAGAEMAIAEDDNDEVSEEIEADNTSALEESARQSTASSHKAYCVECKMSTPICNPQMVEMSTGRPSLKGQCTRCGTAVCKLLPSRK